MKKITLFLILTALFMVGLNAEIGWCGQVWPNSGSFQVSNQDLTVYIQVWKDGATTVAGQGAGISAELYYRNPLMDSFAPIDMEFHGDSGNNDEYKGIIGTDILQAILADTNYVEFYCAVYDSTDSTYAYGTDQNNSGPFTVDSPGVYAIGIATQQDVTVTFKVDMTMVDSVSTVSVSGTFNEWTAEQDTLTDPDNDNIYEGDVVIPSGSNPYQQFKFVNGQDYELLRANRSLEVDDSSPTQVLDVVYFGNMDPNNYTTRDVTVTFNVDVTDSLNAGIDFTTLSICGDEAPLDWDFADNNNPLTLGTNNIWAGSITFAAGTFKTVLYKYARNGGDYEAGFGLNHELMIDDSDSVQVVNDVYGNLAPQAVNPNTIPAYSNINLVSYPNPFNPMVNIKFSLQQPQQVSLKIYNTRGQLVNTLFSNEILQGKVTTSWNGTTEAGKKAASGVYFYKLTTGNASYTKKIMLLK